MITLSKLSLLTQKRFFSICSNCYNYHRAVLYVPGSDKKKIEKALKLGADCTVIDCEDGVALNRKQEARQNIQELLQTNSNVTTRINSIQSGDLFKEDIHQILNSKHKPSCVFVPKIDEFDQIRLLYELIHSHIEQNDKIEFFFYMESALSLLNLRSIIENSLKLSLDKYNSQMSLKGIVFGSDDYCADVGCARSEEALLFARQYLVNACKAFRLQAVDMVYIDYKNLDGLRIQSEQGARFGFTGKQVIHPLQVPIVQEAFTPSKEKIEWARGLIEAFNEHQQSGKGAFNYNGQMIDRPLLLQAQNILASQHKS